MTCSVAATRMSVDQQCGMTRTPRASASAAMRIASEMPPTRATSGWMIRRPPRSMRSMNGYCVVSFSPVAIGVGETAVSRGEAREVVGRERLFEEEHAMLGQRLAEIDGVLERHGEAHVDHDGDLVADGGTDHADLAHVGARIATETAPAELDRPVAGGDVAPGLPWPRARARAARGCSRTPAGGSGARHPAIDRPAGRRSCPECPRARCRCR
jgi:hypothetical protein